MKKSFSLMMALLLAFSGLSPVLADFNDVPTDSWYHPYVEQLVEDGVFDEGEVFRPGDSVNRAEFVKIVITAIDGLKEYEAPAEPTFEDVPENAWFYNYVEAAAQLGIVNGYTDVQGNLTGYFGPADTLNRASAAKVLVNTFQVPYVLSPASLFSDVRSGDWFHDFVVTAYNQSVLDGYGDGRFGSADPVTRAQVAKLVVNSRSPKLRFPSDDFTPADEDQQEDAEIEKEETGMPLEEEPDSTVPHTSPVDTSPDGFVPGDADGDPAIVSAGMKGKFLASYRFDGGLEGFHVRKLTVVNDLAGDNMGDQVTGTTAIKEVILRYPNADGFIRSSRAALSNGEVTLGDLEFYVPKRGNAVIELYADINPMSAVGSVLSGTTFRLGLRDIGNTASTFEAVGLITSTVQTSLGQLDGVDPSTFTVRKSAPIFGVVAGATVLAPGEMDLIRFNATSKGGFSLARMTFEISASSGIQLSDFRLFRGGTLVSNTSFYSGGTDVSQGGGSLSGASDLILSFGSEAIISAGDLNTYTLRAQVTGTTQNGHVSTRIAFGDDNQERTPNTDSLIGGIFADTTAFEQTLTASDHLIWSDRSADNHQYSLTDPGSADWINGYLLRLNGLSSHTLSN